MPKAGYKQTALHKKAIADGMQRAKESGWLPNMSGLRKDFKHITKEQREIAVKKAGKKMTGRPQRMETVCGKHTNNKAAKWWRFQNKALGVILEGKNLNQLIRDNIHLFDPKDIIFDASGCNAARGLGMLNRKETKKTKPRKSWKGWTL